MDVPAQRDDGGVDAPARLPFPEAQRGLPDQGTGEAELPGVRRGSRMMYRFQRDEFNAWQARHPRIEIMAGGKVDDGERTGRVRPPTHQ